MNDEDPQSDNPLVKLSFIPIKKQLKRDLEKWSGIKQKRSEAGKASAEARKLKKLQDEQSLTNSTSVKSVEQKPAKPTDSVNDTVIVNVNDIPLKKDTKEGFDIFWNHYHKVTGKPKTDKEPTIKYWKKLILEEKRKAYKMVAAYAKSQEDPTYLKKARTYLSEKSYNDEFREGPNNNKSQDLKGAIKNRPR